MDLADIRILGLQKDLERVTRSTRSDKKAITIPTESIASDNTSLRSPAIPSTPATPYFEKETTQPQPMETDVPVKSPLRNDIPAGRSNESISAGRPSLVDPKDIRPEGSTVPMSPALSARMQQMTKGPVSPRISSSSSSQYFEEGVERANVPRRERVRTSSQRSNGSAASPAINNPVNKSTETEFGDAIPSTVAVPRMQPVNETRSSNRNSKAEGGPLADIVDPYYSASNTFLPLPAKSDKRMSYAQRPTTPVVSSGTRSPASQYEEAQTPDRIGLAPAAEFFPTPERHQWQEVSPTRSSSNRNSNMSTTASTLRDEPFCVGQIAPEQLNSITIYLMSSKVVGDSTTHTVQAWITLGIYNKNMELLHQVRKSHQALSDLEDNLETKLGLSLPGRAAFESSNQTIISSRRATVDLWFQKTSTQLFMQPRSESARIFCQFLSTDVWAEERERLRPSTKRSESITSVSTIQPMTNGPIKEGFLSKRGKNFGGWKSRYFVLDGPCVRYFECPGGVHLGTIMLSQAQIGRQQSHGDFGATEKTGDTFHHAFLILEPKKRNTHNYVRHVLCAQDDKERDDWIRALLPFIGTDIEQDSDFSAIGYGETVAGQQPSFEARHQRGDSDQSRTVSISAPLNGAVIDNATSWGGEKEKKKKKFWAFGKEKETPPREVLRSPSVTDLTFQSTTVFGAALADAVQMSAPGTVPVAVPSVVYRCIEYLDVKHAEQEEGIYRLSGSNTVIKALKDRFNHDEDLNLLATEEYFDVHAIAGLLKLYLRELPSSILTRDLQRDFLDVSEMPEGQARMVTLRTMVQSLPAENYELLKILSRHLRNIVNHADVNKMSLRNVGIVFSPTLNIPASVFSLFIAEYETIFGLSEGEGFTTQSQDAVRRKITKSPRVDDFREGISPVAEFASYGFHAHQFHFDDPLPS